MSTELSIRLSDEVKEDYFITSLTMTVNWSKNGTNSNFLK